MSKKMLIDWSILAHNSWHMMKSPNYLARTQVEKDEFTRNIATEICYLTTRFQCDEVIFALDSRVGYWRGSVVDTYYAKHTIVRMFQEPDAPRITYYMTWDNKHYVVRFISGPDKWVIQKLNQTELESIKSALTEESELVPYEKIPADVKEFLPKYKGNRKVAQWDYQTTRDEWFELCRELAKNLAWEVGGKVVMVDLAEADDVAKVYSDVNSAHDLVLVTADSDWNQMLVDHLFVKIYNPVKRAWVMKKPDEAEFDLAVKIISGDTSDNISAISLKDATSNIGPKGAEKMIIEHGLDDIYDVLSESANKHELSRNTSLIFLDNIPKNIKAKIKRAISTGSKSAKLGVANWKSFGMEISDLMSTKARAGEDIDLDKESGMA